MKPFASAIGMAAFSCSRPQIPSYSAKELSFVCYPDVYSTQPLYPSLEMLRCATSLSGNLAEKQGMHPQPAQLHLLR